MARKLLPKQGSFPYHVSARSNNREWFGLPMEDIWSLSLHLFDLVREKYGAQPIEYVLMMNHFHLILQTPNANLDRIMNYFLREFSRAVGSKTGRINHVFGGRYRGTIILDSLHYAHAYKYVLRNPVEAGMVRSVKYYSFSSFRRQLGEPWRFPYSFQVDDSLTRLIPTDLLGQVEWLDTRYTSEQLELLRRAMKRTVLAFPTHHRHREVVASLELAKR